MPTQHKRERTLHGSSPALLIFLIGYRHIDLHILHGIGDTGMDKAKRSVRLPTAIPAVRNPIAVQEPFTVTEAADAGTALVRGVQPGPLHSGQQGLVLLCICGSGDISSMPTAANTP